MEYYIIIGIFACGMLLGALATLLIVRILHNGRLSQKQIIEDSLEEMTEKVARLPMQMLDTVSGQIVSQNQQLLHHERAMTTSEINKMTQTAEKMLSIIRDLERDREQKFGQLANALTNTNEHHRELANLTRQLHSVMYQKQARGQWGERMAEDILCLAGMQEGINYSKQSTMQSGVRPDYSFILPKGLTVNMDVKFPLENYSRYVNEPGEAGKSKALAMFINDVRRHIKAIASRVYISPEENTVDYVIMFIPSDLIYTVIFQESSSLLDEALANRVVICSPSTLYAVLVVIRQAVDNFALERSTNDILRLMGNFINEWKNYSLKFESIGKRIEGLNKDYNELSNVRTQKLEKQIQSFEGLVKSNTAGEDAEFKINIETDED